MSHNIGLFPELDAQAISLFEKLGSIINDIVPLKKKFRKGLPYAIRDLSRLLTDERENLSNDYMGQVRFSSAYIHYFLPWNIYRLSRLLQGLHFNIPENGTVIDLGAGPLTALLAIWIARPHLRDKKLHFVCLDKTPYPMKTGGDIFRALAPNSPWKISLVKGGIHTKLREKADLLLSINTLNELEWKGGEAVYGQVEEICQSLQHRLLPEGRMLLVEPGVRDAARRLSIIRSQCISDGYTPIAPCPHSLDCSMPGEKHGAWCHFRFKASNIPKWLKEITTEARLSKETAALSFLYLKPAQEIQEAQEQEELPKETTVVRAISEAFTIPEGQGQYACSDRGLTLLSYTLKQTPLQAGAVLYPRWPSKEKRDEKSQAIILPVAARNTLQAEEAQAPEQVHSKTVKRFKARN